MSLFILKIFAFFISISRTGSVLISGSNPNPDYTVGNNVKFPTEYRTERFYPAYYSNKRPEPAGLLSQLSYGGAYFNVTLTLDDLSGDVNNLNKTKVVVIRTGFSTHAIVCQFWNDALHIER